MPACVARRSGYYVTSKGATFCSSTVKSSSTWAHLEDLKFDAKQNGETDRQTDIDRQRDRDRDRQTDRQTDRDRQRQRDRVNYVYVYERL